MVRNAFGAKSKHEREAQFELRRRDEIALASDYEGACRYVEPSWRCLGDLVCIHPVDLCDDLGVPGSTMANFESCSFIQSHHWNGSGPSARVLDDSNCCAWHVGVHEEVALIEMPFHQGLVLLGILSRDYEEIFGADKPVEFLEPKYLSHPLGRLLLLLTMLSDLFDSVSLSVLDGKVGRIFGLLFFLVTLFLDLKVLLDVHLRSDMKIHVHFDDGVEVSKSSTILIIIYGSVQY